MDELIKSINNLIKEIRTLTAIVASVLPHEEYVEDEDGNEEQSKTYLDGTPIA